jgi:hypothetical protein
MLHFTFIWQINFNQIRLQTYQDIESTVGVRSDVLQISNQSVSVVNIVFFFYTERFIPLFTSLLPVHRVTHQTLFGFSLIGKLTPITQSNWRFHPHLKILSVKPLYLPHTMVASENGVLQHWLTFHTDVTNSVTHNEVDRRFLKFSFQISVCKASKMCGLFL